MSQTSISAGGQPIGVAGQIADSAEGRDIVSGFNQEATINMPFGYGVMHGPTPDGYVLPSGASGTMEVVGLNVWSHAHNRAGTPDSGSNYSGDLGASGLLPKASLQIGRRGRFLVPVENTVQNGDRLYCRVVSTGTLTQGSFHGTNLGGSYMRDCTAQGIFRSATYTALDGTTKVAVVEVDFTSKPA